MARRYPRSAPHIARVLLGCMFGYFLGTWLRLSIAPCAFGPLYSCLGLDRGTLDGNQLNGSALQNGSQVGSSRKLILVGVMTAQKYLDTRVVAAYQTWAKSIHGQVIFFSSEGSSLPQYPEIPIVALQSVDDTYPPQKKSFLMLKYMYENYKDQFEWFMRADDDVYIRGDKLAMFLHSVNGSRAHFIGQAGMGNTAEIGRLSLKNNDNYCMGGTGIIFSLATLEKIVPHISFCLKNLYTTHEDVEIGRCVQRFADVACTWAFEMQHLMYQNHQEPNGSFTGKLQNKEVHRAISLHPIKKHKYQYRMHSYMVSVQSADLRRKVLTLSREITNMEALLHEVHPKINDYDAISRMGMPLSLNKFVPRKRNEVLSWEFISKALYSDKALNPKKGMETYYKQSLEYIVMQVMTMINKNARQRGRTIDFKDILYGYHRINPMHGSDYILDLLLVYRKHKGQKMTIPVRRHAYLHQTFSELHFVEEGPMESAPTTHQPDSYNTPAKPALFQLVINKLGWHEKSSQITSTSSPDGVVLPDEEQAVIHFILPLAGRYQTFLHFMNNFEEVCLKERKAVLAVMLFHSDSEDRSEDTVAYIQSLTQKYPQHDLRVVHLSGPFSRGLALQKGTELFSSDALLYFVDVDIFLSKGALRRIRKNTVKHKQVYYPIVFSQYDPITTCDGETCTPKPGPLTITQDIGYWRQFGFGIVSLYSCDLKVVGGFDTKIQGWGKEDVDLFTRFVSSNITMMRAVDPGMVHIFHPIVCDPSLEAAQYQMCLGSKAASYGSTASVAKMVYNTPDILDKNEMVVDENNNDDEIPDTVQTR